MPAAHTPQVPAKTLLRIQSARLKQGIDQVGLARGAHHWTHLKNRTRTCVPRMRAWPEANQNADFLSRLKTPLTFSFYQMHLEESHRIVSLGLSKQKQRELGLNQE